jgi:hypothetical protein
MPSSISRSRVKLRVDLRKAAFALYRIYYSNMAAISSTRSLDVETRVQDYLNDKLQTTADLNNLESLFQNVQQQHELLQVQVRSTCVRSKS